MKVNNLMEVHEMRNLIMQPNCSPKLFEGFLDDFFGKGLEFPSRDSGFMPRVNIKEDDGSVHLTFELPGLEKGAIKVVVQDALLTVSGERKLRTEDKNDRYVRSEINSGSFYRSFTLSDQIDPGSVTADYSNGLLEVNLTKKEEKKPREIQVNVS